MNLHRVTVGTKVKVGEDNNKPELCGMVGTVRQSWGNSHYHHSAVLVRFEDGWYEFFWNHEVQKAEEAIRA